MAEMRLLTATPPPTTVDDYLDTAGGQGLQRAIRIGPDQLIDEVGWAGLRGRGGAGFPTARKWATVRDTVCPTRYVVCNAAEGEPGTFKDRWLLRHHPHLVLEGLAIAAHAVGASRGFIATKGIFEAENAAVERALADLVQRDLLGGLPIEIVRGPDAYLYGEEKAMLEVIEGRPALPRLLPPYQVGLFARPGSPNPTVVNNVETLAHVTLIARDGGCRFRILGSDGGRGTMLFTVSGDVQRPGVYELPLGTSLGHLVHQVAGGPADGRTVKAVFPGASVGVIPGERLDEISLDFDSMRAAGTGLGSGGFVVYDDASCIVAATAAFIGFLADESCAQCPACHQGARTIADTLAAIDAGGGDEGHLGTMRSRIRSVTGGSRCGLPAGTAAVVASVLDTFGPELEAHLGRLCPTPRPLPVPKLVGADDAPGGFVVAGQPAGRGQEVAGVR